MTAIQFESASFWRHRCAAAKRAIAALARHVEQPDVEPLWPAPAAPLSYSRTAEVIRQMAARREMTVHLLKRNERLRRELSSICLASEGIRIRANRVVSLARAAAARD